MRRIASRLTSLGLAVSLALVMPASIAQADNASDDPTGPAANPAAASSSVDPHEALSTVRELLTAEPGETATASPATGTDPAGAAAPDPTMAMAQLATSLPQLAGRELRQARALLARPTDPRTNGHNVSYPSDAVLAQTCGPHICVTYATNTPHQATAQWAQRTLAELERAWDIEVNQLGYRPPPADSGGIDSRLDVYLLNSAAQGIYGYCAPEPRPATQRSQVTSYCVLDNDMADFDMPPVPSLKVTAAHEFFHTIQFGYDAGEDGWIMENTATWMEEQVADEINDNRQFLTGSQLIYPGKPLDEFSTSAFDYGNWIFFQRLSQRFGRESVRQLWELMDAGGRDLYSTQAVTTFVNAKGASWRDFYADFVAGNHAPRHFYEEGAAYPRSVLHKRFRVRPGRLSHGARFPRLRHLSSRSVQFARGAGLSPRRGWLRVSVTSKKGTAAMPAARAVIFGKDGSVSSVRIRLGARGNGSARIRFGTKVRRVVVVLANSSTRMDACWTYSNFACAGYGRDDNQVMTVRGSVR